MPKKFIVIDKYNDVVGSFDQLWEATEYARKWKEETGDEIYIYTEERFY